MATARAVPYAGNTSTDVEKTHTRHKRNSEFQKHLHGRREDKTMTESKDNALETPPRTWRRLRHRFESVRREGNTSTDVEKTFTKTVNPFPFGKHLHGRGEDHTLLPGARFHIETPPRTWRRPQDVVVEAVSAGNTSTDVEKTFRFSRAGVDLKKHLHGRGEDET